MSEQNKIYLPELNNQEWHKLNLPYDIQKIYQEYIFKNKLYNGDSQKYKGVKIKEYRKRNCLRKQNDRFYHPTKNNRVYDKKTGKFRQTKTKFNTETKDYQLFSLDRLNRQQIGIYYPKPFWR